MAIRPQATQQLPDRLIAPVALPGRSEHGLVHGERAAGKSRQALENEAPLFLARRTGREAGRGDGARIDHRIRPPVFAALDGRQGIERQAGRVDAQAPPRLVRAERLQHKREHERLRHAHDRERNVPVAAPIGCAADADHAKAEEILRDVGERGIDVRDPAVPVGPEALMSVRHQGPDDIRRRQAPGRDIGRFDPCVSGPVGTHPRSPPACPACSDRRGADGDVHVEADRNHSERRHIPPRPAAPA